MQSRWRTFLLTKTNMVRAAELHGDNQRVREASQAKGMQYSVKCCLPADVIGFMCLCRLRGGTC